MRTIQLIVGAAALVAAVIHGGCATASNPNDTATSWELGSNVDDELALIVIPKGCTAGSVLELLGEPMARKQSRKDPAVEEWIYDRNVHFGLEMKGMSVGTGRITAMQEQRLREIAEISIRDGLVEHVKITRIRNQDGLDPIHR